MKKLLALLMLLCLLPLCAAAEMDEDVGVTVDLDGAEVFFVPVEDYCLTRESSASVFNRIGGSQREIVPWMEANDVYALIFNQTARMEIQLVVRPTTEMDFDEMTKYGLDMMCETSESYYNSMYYDVESVKLYHTFDGHSYVQTTCSYTYEDGSVEHLVEYFTCQSGYAVCVLMFPYEGASTEEQIFLCESVVDSLWLSESATEAQYVELASEGICVRFRSPEGVKCLTKTSTEEDWAGLPKDLVRTRRKELAWNDLLGVIVSSDGKWEIKWAAYDAGGGDLDDLSDVDVEDFRQQVAAGYTEDGCNVSKSTCVRIGPYRYAETKFNYAAGGSLVHAKEYCTLQDGWIIFVGLISYGEPVPDEAYALLEEILESQIVIVDR